MQGEKEMNCPNCNTWNPDDKEVCWRCQHELPKVQPKKQRRQTFGGLPIWVWVAFLLFFVVTSLGQCMMVGAPAG
jgi:predicted amidophosphoribosyltransferase